jgi:PAP2 superfamily
VSALYNPYAAVPSMHFGYALVVGAAVAWQARRRLLQLAGLAYPVFVLLVTVATGNHFLLDAAAGAAAVLLAFLATRMLSASKAWHVAEEYATLAAPCMMRR